MKSIAAVLIMWSLVGCANNRITVPSSQRSDTRPGVQDKYPYEFMFASSEGKKAGFSAKELESIVRSYVLQKKIPYDLAGKEVMIWIDTSGGKKIADVSFNPPRFGEESLVVAIDKDGHVISHRIVRGVD